MTRWAPLLALLLAGCELDVRGGTLEQRELDGRCAPRALPALERARRAEAQRAPLQRPGLPAPIVSCTAPIAGGLGRDALDAFRAATRDDPQAPEGWLGVARILAERGRLEEAYTTARAGLAWSPESRALGKLESELRATLARGTE